MEKRLFTIAMILLLSLSMLAVLKMNVAQAAPYATLQDAEIATNMSDQHWGTAKNVVVTDITGAGVRITFDPSNPGVEDKLAISDNFPVDQLAGGALYDSHYGDFRGYTAYRMTFKNNGGQDVKVALFINTGYLSPPHTSNENTFWQSDWVTIGASSSATVTLDFSSAEVYEATDDPVYTHWPDGTKGIAVWRLEEVSNIGFQMLSSQSADVVVSDITRLYVDPAVSTKYYGVDSFFDVFITVEGVNDLYGLDIDIRWDNALMTYKEEEYTTYLNAMWGAGSWQVTKHENGVVAGVGYYKFVAVCTHTPPGFSTSGNQRIFRVGFNVVDPQTNSKKTAPIYFATDKLSDSNAQSISHTCDGGVYEVWGMEVTMDMTHAGGYSRTARKTHDDEVGHGEELFTLTMTIAEARNLAEIEFEIRFDTSMINGVSYTKDWGSGTIDINEAGGIVTGHLIGSGNPTTLATLTFKPDPAYWRIWKDSALQTPHDDINPTGIHFESITLRYTDLPDLTWTSGAGGGINVPHPNFSYTFSPIKGDLDLDGLVDIGDLGWEAGLYDSPDEMMNLIGDTLIDIFDLVIIASNFWYHYVPPPP